MMAALENFNKMTVAHKMLILGDMRELGAESAAEHQKIVDFIKACEFEKVIFVGSLFAAANSLGAIFASLIGYYWVRPRMLKQTIKGKQ